MEERNSHILSFLENKTAEYAERIAVGMKGMYGWSEITYKGVGILSRKIARYLIEDLGIKKVNVWQYYQNRNLNMRHAYLLLC